MSANWDRAYTETPPWDIGRPQPMIRELADNAEIAGHVLDLGCGTGENALYLAERGYEVVGVDWAARAIASARAKATERRLSARFEVADALDLAVPPEPFDTVIDCGLFHVFSDDERVRYRESLARVIRSGGTYLMMCFSERQPGDWGPRRVTQAEIRATFVRGWTINYIHPAEFETRIGPALAWLSSISPA
jgi:cyclopropane fatty-acyl-phospholipid synthase-like methyltransferase